MEELFQSPEDNLKKYLPKGRKDDIVKIRNGFVSNSSSSSFIVAFPKDPESEKEIHDIMFPYGETRLGTYCSSPVFSSKVIANQVFNDIKNRDATKIVAKEYNNGSSTADDFIEILSHNYFDFDGLMEKSREIDEKYIDKHGSRDKIYDDPDYIQAKNVIWEKHKKDSGKIAEKKFKKFVKSLDPNDVIFLLNYNDNTDLGTEMEHGNIFGALENIRISLH